MNRQVLQAGLLLMGSGFCALVYQTVWFRMLRVVFGGTTAATSAVLAIFMGGLGLGSWWLGRRVEQSRNPLGLYAKLEGGIALSAALTPLLIAGVAQIYLATGGSTALGGPVSTTVRLGLSALALGVPAFLMGGTLPALARAVETDEDAARSGVSALYGMNTLGAVLGVALTTFFFVEAVGARWTLWGACLANAGVAGLAWHWARGQQRDPADIDETGPPPDPAVLVAAALVGFAFLLMELVWYRMLGPILGGSTFTFGLILAVALAGIGIGGLLYASTKETAATWDTLALTCALEALLLGLPYALGDRIAVLATLLWPTGDTSFWLLVGSWLVITAIVVLPAAVVSGYQFPLIVALAGQGDEDVGRDVGLVYACNTVGAIAGSLAGGFGLMPLFGAPALWRMTVVGLTVLAGLALWKQRPLNRRPAALAALLSVGALWTFTALGPTAVWRHSGVGVKRIVLVGTPNHARNIRHVLRRSATWEQEGVEASIAMNSAHGIALIANGKSDGHTRFDASTTILAGLIAAARHPSPRRVLVIGLGTGETVGWLAQLDDVERIDVIEIEPAVVEVARQAADATLNALASPKVHLVIGDAREVIQTTDQTWDLIISEPSNPYRVGVAGLFTQDFYHHVTGRLAPGGVFGQWLQAYAVDALAVQTAYATLGSVFPEVETWELTPHADLLFLATREPQPHDADRIRRLVGEDPLRTALMRVDGTEGLAGFYACFVGDARLARSLSASHTGALHTDDHPVFEFGVARTARNTGFGADDVRAISEKLGSDVPPIPHPPGAWALLEQRSVRHLAQGFSAMPDPEHDPDPDRRARRRARNAYADGDLDAAFGFWESQRGPEQAPLDRVMRAEVYAHTGDPRLPDVLEPMGDRPVEARFAAARYLDGRGQIDQAATALVEGFEHARVDPWVYLPMFERALDHAVALAERHPRHRDSLLAALSQPFAARVLDDRRKQVRVAMAGEAPSCVAAWQDLEPWVPWTRERLQARAACYAAAGHPRARRAAGDLATFVGQAP